MLERHQHLSRWNPFFRHAEARYWIAYRDRRPVGRISAQVDQLHLERYADATGFFGLIEAIDDGDVFAALFDAAESWLREKGMRRVVGPFNFSTNEEIGTLVEGFDTPPMFLMAHGRPYYDRRIRELGYRKEKDVTAHMLEVAKGRPPIMQATVERAGWGRVQLRPIRFSHLHEDLEIIRDIFNDAWQHNWNFVPFASGELDALGSSLKLFVPQEFVQIASIDGRPAAMLVLLPNLNEAIRDLDGHLLPTGWIRLLWRLKRRGPRTARVVLMGVRQKYQRTALGMALLFLMMEAVHQPVLDRDIRQIELSWIVEDNLPMQHVMDRIGAPLYKRYRIYEKSLV